MIVVDTSVLVDRGRGHPAARDAITTALRRGDTLAASVLTKVELLRNVRSHERRLLRDLFDVLTMVPVTDEIAQRAGALARQYRDSHQGIDVTDFVIAATAEAEQAELWTRNLKHFPMFAELQAPY